MKKTLQNIGPVLIGLLLAALAAGLGPKFFSTAMEDQWKIETLYSAVFDMSAMAAAFLFAFYTFAKTSDSEFIKDVRATPAFREFMDYLVSAVFVTAAVAVMTVPMMILTPTPKVYFTVSYFAVVVWAFLVGIAGGATWRSTRQFMALTAADGRKHG